MVSYIKSISHAIRDIPTFALQQIFPHALNSFEYMPLGSGITYGPACLWFGGTLAYQCGIIELIKSRVFKKNPPQPAAPISSMRLLGLAAGAALMGIGAYLFVSNVASIWNYAHSLDPTDVHPVYPAPTAQEKALAGKVLAKLKECPLANTLWDTAQKAGKVSLRICPNDEDPSFSNWNHITRTINLKMAPQLDEKAGCAVFELCNERQSKVFEAITRKCFEGVDLHTYVEEKVKGEWLATQCHHQVVSGCIKQAGWRESLDVFRERSDWKSSEDYWNSVKIEPQFQGYLANYIRLWQQHCQSFFCRKQQDPARCMRTFK